MPISLKFRFGRIIKTGGHSSSHGNCRILKALQKKTGEAAVIIVAQRISTILHADQIIVLEDGGIAGIGTHEELMEQCETYQEIARSQLSEQELKSKGGAD